MCDLIDSQQPWAFKFSISFYSPQPTILACLNTNHCLNPGCPHKVLVSSLPAHSCVPSVLSKPRIPLTVYSVTIRWFISLEHQHTNLTWQARDFLWIPRTDKNPSNLKSNNSSDTERTFFVFFALKIWGESWQLVGNALPVTSGRKA